MRDDTGALRENFVIAELLKSASNTNRFPLSFFWRTKTQQEIDFVQDYNGQITAYEIKWNPKKKVSRPSSFVSTYNPIKHVITRSNRASYLL
jgi:uncharacterized protein